MMYYQGGTVFNQSDAGIRFLCWAHSVTRANNMSFFKEQPPSLSSKREAEAEALGSDSPDETSRWDLGTKGLFVDAV